MEAMMGSRWPSPAELGPSREVETLRPYIKRPENECESHESHKHTAVRMHSNEPLQRDRPGGLTPPAVRSTLAAAPVICACHKGWQMYTGRVCARTQGLARVTPARCLRRLRSTLAAAPTLFTHCCHTHKRDSNRDTHACTHTHTFITKS